MTPEFLKDKKNVENLFKAAKNVSKNYEGITDDFTQFMFLRYLEGSKGKVSQLFIDFLRSEYGKTTGSKTNLSVNLKNPVSLDKVEDMEAMDMHDVDFKKILSQFKGEDRAILSLYYQWDLTLKEIGETFGVSEATICLTLKELHKKAKIFVGSA